MASGFVALRDAERRQRSRAWLESARRVLGSRPTPGSGLFRRRSLSWRCDAFEFPLADMKAAARAAQGSVNDLLLAGLVGGFQRYHAAMGVQESKMPIAFPISVRNADDPLGGNRIVGGNYAAPLDLADPIERVRHVQEFVKRTRAEPALDIVIRLMPVVTRLPLAALTTLSAGLTTTQDAQVSNVPGIAETVFLAGARVTHLYPFGPVPGCGMMITMVTHDGRCCIGINSDRAAVTQPELLVDSLRAGLDEILGLATGSPTRPRRETGSPDGDPSRGFPHATGTQRNSST